jgi:endonuclease G, mitochondrial
MSHLHIVFLFFVSLLGSTFHSNQKFLLPTHEPNPADSIVLDSLHIPYLLADYQLLHYLGFSLQYNEDHEQACWVGYRLNSSRLLKEASRTDNFRHDPQITTGTATNADYAKSGYDRGHLAPAGDMAWSDQAMSESFFYSNMSPQVPGFNRGIWKKLEEQVRNWVNDTTELFVVTGPILEEGLVKIGTNEVSVPKFFFKALLRRTPHTLHAIGFILPNASSNQPLMNYAVSVDSLENVTRINFFHQLPDSIEHEIERAWCVTCW